ncbi:SusC/RagA family TonB-linked outer membrane protein [Chryseobacterium hagamense]|uniref:SusC/RagA family TonB-linked outer membrane protein n=1 Tax=Chryseobacterium hagamense TaxID=395935 RepID=A0A511YPX6_9FLAO|nr:TonB-dependent receptor [Chryseobacterium hagamense]GEN77228.1 SusC/RagA family TonB-linked outer membrane protein [Chryseobacterium hagamense]
MNKILPKRNKVPIGMPFSGKTCVAVFFLMFEMISAQKTGTVKPANDSTKTKVLDEVVVVGYGTQKRKDITGSVASIPKDRLQNLPITNFTQALQGSTAGVTVTTRSSVPGSTGGIRIRGINSIRADSTPLIVMDGAIFYGSFNDINTRDIESIEILKDASATAIYGTKGTNGVILISTKRGKTGLPSISYSVSSSVDDISHKLLPLGPEAYVQKYADYMHARGLTQTTILPNQSEIENYNKGITTDWLKEVTQPGSTNEHNVSVYGGTENVKYYVSGNYTDQKGVVKGYQYHRFNFRTNLDINVTKWLKTGVSFFYVNNNYSGGRANLLYATAMSPYSVPYKANGEYNIFPMDPELLYTNPLLGLATDRMSVAKNLSGNAYMEIKPGIKGLSYKIIASYALNTNAYGSYTGRKANDNVGNAYKSNNEYNDWNLENILTYNRDFEKHHLDATLMYGVYEKKSESTWASGVGFFTDDFSYNNIGAATTKNAGSGASRSSQISQLGRVNYSYDSRYSLSLTARRDGASVFGKNTSKFSVFPAMAVGWNINNESFLKKSTWIDQIKLRFSLGETGNPGIDPYQTLTLLGTSLYPFSGNIVTGTYLGGIGNPDLKWETTRTTNIGLDFGFFNRRINGTVEVYKTHTRDLLLSRKIPDITGTSSVLDNIGELENKGLDITLNTVNIKTENFKWETGFVFSTFRNKITQLYGDGKDDIANGWFIGRSLGTVYNFDMVGVWQEGEDSSKWDPTAKPGDLKFRDVNGDGKITNEDLTFTGKTLPDWTGSISNTFTYKNISLSIFIDTVQGLLRGNNDISYGDEIGRRNIPQQVGYWTPENKSNDFPSLTYTNTRGYWFTQDASYVRLRDIRLTYTFPASLLKNTKIQNMSLYVAGRNLYTWTKWIGWDPESNQASRGSGDFNNNYPLSRNFAIGLNITL